MSLNFLLMQASPTVTQPPAYQVEATKTYFTTSTYYTTLIDQGSTLTRSRTRVKSSVITETYAADTKTGYNKNSFSTASAYEPFKSAQKQTSRTKYSSLGPNIYAKIMTMLDTLTFTFTDVTGRLATSKEIITQTSTSLFSTTRLPATISLEGGDSQAIGSRIQLSPSRLAEIKQSYLDGKTDIVNVDPTVQTSLFNGILATKPGASLIWDKPYLSSLKESYQSSINAASSSGSSVGVSVAEPTETPLTDVDLPGNGPPVLRPPGSNGGDIASISPSKPQEQANQVANVDEAGGISSGQAGGDEGSQSSQNNEVTESSVDQQTTPSDGENGGVINAVVGGIAEGLGDVFGTNSPGTINSPINGLNVDLGPVLDAVATLLRGPIRSAIANRRSEAQDRSDGPDDYRPSIRPSKTVARAVLPSVAREPINNQNYIPVGGLGRAPQSKARPRPRYDFIPIQQRQSRPKGGQRGSGPIPLALRREAQPRIDFAGEAEINDNYLNGDIPNVVEHYGDDVPTVINNGSIIINDHIIEADDPTIIDVLSRKDQYHLFGDSNGPMELEIVAGIPMNIPQGYGTPGQPISPEDGIVVEPLNPQSDLSAPPPRGGYPKKNRPGLRRPEKSRPRPPPIQKRPPPQPTSPRRPPVNNRPYPPRPNTNNLPARPRPSNAQGPKRPQFPRKPIQGNTIQNTIDSNDSDNQFSVNNEVVVPAPPNVIKTKQPKKKPPPPKSKPSSSSGPRRPPPNGRPQSIGQRPNFPPRPSTTKNRPNGAGIRPPNTPKRPESFNKYPRKPGTQPNRPPKYPSRPNTGPKRPPTNNQRPPIPPPRKPVNGQRPQGAAQRQPGPPRRPSLPNNGRQPPRPAGQPGKVPPKSNGQNYPIRQPNLTRRPPQTTYFSNSGTRNQPPKPRYPTNQIDIVDGTNDRKPVVPQQSGLDNGYQGTRGQSRPPQYGQTTSGNPGNGETFYQPRPGSQPSPGFQVVTNVNNQGTPISSTAQEEQGPFQAATQDSNPIDSDLTNTGLYVPSDVTSPNSNAEYSPAQEANTNAIDSSNDGTSTIYRENVPSQGKPSSGSGQQNSQRPLPSIKNTEQQTNEITSQNERRDKPTNVVPSTNNAYRPNVVGNTIGSKSPSETSSSGNTVTKNPYTTIDQPSVGPPYTRPGRPRPTKQNGRPQRPGSYKGGNSNRYKYGDRVPYNDNNPNKARRPNGARPTIGATRVDPIIESSIKNNVGATGYGVQLDGSVGDLTVTNSLGELQIIQTTFNWADPNIDPSFVAPGANQDRRTNLPRPYRTRLPPAKDNVDYEGWKTDKDDDPSIIRLSSSYFDDLPLVEKEGAKTTTYANEWKTYDPANENGNTKIRFTPQQRPKLNTNFAGEWTAATGTLYDGAIQTTAPLNNAPVNYATRTNSNWNAGPNSGNGFIKEEPQDQDESGVTPQSGSNDNQPLLRPHQQNAHGQSPKHNWNSRPSGSTPIGDSGAQSESNDWDSNAPSPTPQAGPESETQAHNWNSGRHTPTSPTRGDSSVGGHNWSSGTHLDHSPTTPTGGDNAVGGHNWSSGNHVNGNIVNGDETLNENGFDTDDSSFGGSAPIRGRPVRPTRPGSPNREPDQPFRAGTNNGNPRQRPTELFVDNQEAGGFRQDLRPGVTPLGTLGTTIRRPGSGFRRPGDGPTPTDAGVTVANGLNLPSTRPRPGQSSNRPPFGIGRPSLNRPGGPTRGPVRLRPLNEFDSSITRPGLERTDRPPFGNRQPSFNEVNGQTRSPIRNRPQRPPFSPIRGNDASRQPTETNLISEIPIDSSSFGNTVETEPPTGEPTRFSPRPSDQSSDDHIHDHHDELLGIPDVEPSLDVGDDSERPQREPVVKPFRPTPEKDGLEDDYIEVIEGTFEPTLPTVPFKTDDLPFTTNVVVSGGFGGKDKPLRTKFRNDINVSPSSDVDNNGGAGQVTRRTRIKITRTVTRTKTKIRLPTIGIRPASVRPDLIRPTATLSRFDELEETSSVSIDGPRRTRPKFPPRKFRPSSGQDGDDREESEVNQDLIGLIPIDRQPNDGSQDNNEISGNLRDDTDDPRILTGGPFIPNFGGGGRPGRPVKEDRIPDKNTGRGSATLQKVRVKGIKIMPESYPNIKFDL